MLIPSVSLAGWISVRAIPPRLIPYHLLKPQSLALWFFYCLNADNRVNNTIYGGCNKVLSTIYMYPVDYEIVRIQ